MHLRASVREPHPALENTLSKVFNGLLEAPADFLLMGFGKANRYSNVTVLWGNHTKTILIRGARQLITLRGVKGPRRGPVLGELSIIPDGSVLIRDGVIEEVGPSRRVENLAGAREAVEINAAGRVVMPGFVDCHTHLIFPTPGAPDDERAERAVHAASGKRLRARAQGHLDAMARHGTTTVEAKTAGSPDD